MHVYVHVCTCNYIQIIIFTQLCSQGVMEPTVHSYMCIHMNELGKKGAFDILPTFSYPKGIRV